MGKQTAVAMTIKDEIEFITFLKSTGNIQIVKNWSPTKKPVFIDSFATDEEKDWDYLIWNREFDWRIKLMPINKNFVTDDRRFYIETSEAPVIEYSRHNFQEECNYGRIYWSKDFATPNKLKYDVEQFNKWYLKVAGWIRKKGKQETKGTLNTFYLPDAWKTYKE